MRLTLILMLKISLLILTQFLPTKIYSLLHFQSNLNNVQQNVYNIHSPLPPFDPPRLISYWARMFLIKKKRREIYFILKLKIFVLSKLWRYMYICTDYMPPKILFVLRYLTFLNKFVSFGREGWEWGYRLHIFPSQFFIRNYITYLKSFKVLFEKYTLGFF